MTRISSQADARRFLGDLKRKIVGMGLTAFSRITPSLFTDQYEIVCYKWGSDLSALERYCSIRAIERDFSPREIPKLNTQSMLRHPGVISYLRGLGRVAFFQYKTTKWVEEFCRQEGWLLLANPRALRDRFENKETFFKLVRRLDLPAIPGEQWEFRKLTEDAYRQLIRRLGKRLVLQLTSFSEGGGKGTYFVGKMDEFRVFQDRAKERLDLSRPQTVNVVKFIEGMSASITGCVTRHGVLTGVVQTQVLDIPELIWTEGRRGIWRGHDWSFREYSSSVQEAASRIAKGLGEAMAKDGYRGMFGVDLMIDRETGTVYPNEINPRYTGAFPVYAFLQYKEGEVPFDVFQILEFFDAEYRVDFDAVDAAWKTPKQGAFVNLHNQEPERWVQAMGDLPAGVYRLAKSKVKSQKSKFRNENVEFRIQDLGNELQWVRGGVTPLDIQKPDEFVVTDGVPKQGDLVKPHLRCGKIIFGRSILEGRYDRLSEWARTIVRLVYDRLDLRPVAMEEDN